MKQTQFTVSTRQRCAGPNHHLWNNNGTWWLHCTLHLPDHTARRVRVSLSTRCVREARRKRDGLFDRHARPVPVLGGRRRATRARPTPAL